MQGTKYQSQRLWYVKKVNTGRVFKLMTRKLIKLKVLEFNQYQCNTIERKPQRIKV